MRPFPLVPPSAPQPIQPPQTTNAERQQSKTEDAFASLSRLTLQNNGAGLNALNNALSNTSFVAAALNGSYKLRGIGKQPRTSGLKWYKPHRFSGIWPGIYSRKNPFRRHLIDTGLALGSAWSAFDGFAQYSSETGSTGTGLAAGMAEAVNQFGFNLFYAEPIIYKSMDLTMALLGKLSPQSQLHQINRELSGDIPKALLKQGIPTWYRLTRSLVGGAIGVLTINSIMAGFSKWITPMVASHLGPKIDEWFQTNQPMKAPSS